MPRVTCNSNCNLPHFQTEFYFYGHLGSAIIYAQSFKEQIMQMRITPTLPYRGLQGHYKRRRPNSTVIWQNLGTEIKIFKGFLK